MAADIFIIRNRIPELSYAFTLNGVELPVLDITHPLFAKCTDEKVLEKLLPYVEKNAEENAAKFNKIPAFVKRYLARHSFAMAELLQMDDETSYASGITTLMMKLGPDLIGKGKKRFWDRQVTKGFGALVIRMRVRDISKCQAEALKPLLIKSPGKDLCIINIAGGAASDSINALLLIQNEDPGLLKKRKIEINVLDIDSFGPSFADRSITALKESGGRFKGLDISLRHIDYDWNHTEKLSELLSARKEWIQICASEGGLFEYCSDEVIKRNLDAVHRNSNDDVIIAGSLLHDISEVDAGMKAALKISTNIKPVFLGIEGLKKIAGESHWQITSTIPGNPRYMVFTMRKR